MADKGIIFSAAMVRALLSGTKTQTRRLLNPQPGPECAGFERVFATPPFFEARDPAGKPCYPFAGKYGASPFPTVRYAPGDRLYVREHWKTDCHYDVDAPRKLSPNVPILTLADNAVHTRAFSKEWGRHRQGMHMPRWASRMWLAVTDVRVQRLQEISEADAIEEGIEPQDGGWQSYETIQSGPHKGARHPHAVVPNRSPITSYGELWNSLHIKPGERWEDDPWVVAVSFSVRLGNIDEATHD